MYKEDLALNNLQWLICHKTQPNQTSVYFKVAILHFRHNTPGTLPNLCLGRCNAVTVIIVRNGIHDTKPKPQ